MSRTLVLPNIFFEEVANQLREGNDVTVTVQGDSMYPFLHSGDTILLRPYQGEELPLFCAVFYQWGGHYMTHRIVRRDDDAYTMLGDGNVYRFETLTDKEIIGVLVSCHRPDGRSFDCLSKRWLRYGHFWYWLRPVRRYLLWLMKKFS